MKYLNLLKVGEKKLSKKNIVSSILDCEIILSDLLNIRREDLLLNLDKKAKSEEISKFLENISKRKKKVPVSYITGKKEFWKTSFIVDRSVLIPRPDTELIVEESLNLIPKSSSKRILDLGTGSGCIIISILLERLNCKGAGVDISKAAIKIAKINAKMQHLENRVSFVNSDIDKFFFNNYDFIVSNPPYINKFKLSSLNEDVRLNEPPEALDGGPGGYSKLKKVINRSAILLKTKGFLVLEIDRSQFFGIKELLKQNNFFLCKTRKDYSGHKRCIISQKI